MNQWNGDLRCGVRDQSILASFSQLFSPTARKRMKPATFDSSYKEGARSPLPIKEQKPIRGAYSRWGQAPTLTGRRPLQPPLKCQDNVCIFSGCSFLKRHCELVWAKNRLCLMKKKREDFMHKMLVFFSAALTLNARGKGFLRWCLLLDQLCS